MLPGAGWSSEPVVAPFLSPRTEDPESPLESYDRGPVAVQDTSEGLSARNWTARYDIGTGDVELVGHGVLFNQAGIVQISLTFDQTGRPFIAFCDGTNILIWWYDSSIPGVTITDLGTGIEPFCQLDIRINAFSSSSDILLFYNRDSSVYYRQQRDRYGVELETPIKNVLGLEIINCGMSENQRMTVKTTGVNVCG